MSSAIALSPVSAPSSISSTYHPHGRSDLQRLFHERFPAFEAAYEEKYSADFGRLRLPLISGAAEAFDACGDWENGIARIRCPDCGFDYFRPFSCKSFFLCPSCGQKRTLLLGEYLADDLLLRLPHRQFVWTIPKALRGFLKRDRSLFAAIGKLIFALLAEYYSEAAGRPLVTGMVSSHQTFGEYASWHPHWHTIVLEGGFDSRDRFFFIPIGASDGLQELWRRRVIGFLLKQGLLDEALAESMLSWQHSGFSVEAGTRIYDDTARKSLSQYIVRAPVGLEKLTWDQREDTISWKAAEKGHWRGEVRHFDSLDFIAQVTLHIPPKGKHLVRRYGVYSSRGRSTWKDRPALRTKAPERWYGRAQMPAGKPSPAEVDMTAGEAVEVGAAARKKAWARLLAKVYEVDPFLCPECGGKMAVIAVIQDPVEIRGIIACLAGKGRGPPR